jgi:hypothetical protein
MDGGVTAAAIEKEAEKRDAETDPRYVADPGYAKQHDAPVRECPDPEQHGDGLPDAVDALTEAVKNLHTRAEKAEQEREEERSEADSLFRQLEATEASLREANEVAKSLRAAEPRPLTPDDITDEMVERAWAEWVSLDDRDAHSMRLSIRAALTGPTRPEWADLEDVLDAQWPEGINGAKNGHIARMLHVGGVRVEGQP